MFYIYNTNLHDNFLHRLIENKPNYCSKNATKGTIFLNYLSLTQVYNRFSLDGVKIGWLKTSTMENSIEKSALNIAEYKYCWKIGKEVGK